MGEMTFNYKSVRAQKARLGAFFSWPILLVLMLLATILIVSGVLLLSIMHLPIGWLLIGLSIAPWMVVSWVKGDLHELPVKPGTSLDALLDRQILGRLSRQPSPRELASVLYSSPGGVFMAARFGLRPGVVQELMSTDPRDTEAVWQRVLELHAPFADQPVTGAEVVVALMQSVPDYEKLIAQIHLDKDDIESGIVWFYRIKGIIKRLHIRRRTGGIARDWSFGYIPLLERFGQNISQQYAGAPSDIVEVQSHIHVVDEIIDTFSRNGTQNIAIVGETGAGKTTIIHAFAEKIMGGDSRVPASLQFRQVFMLDSAALIAAAPGRGELESLISQVLSEAHNAKNIIVCLDNAQLFFEEGVGAVDISNVLQPILEAGRLKLILSLDEQKLLRITQRNPALVNALNRINVKPASAEDTMTIMEEQVVYLEALNNVIYMYQSLKEAYRLGDRYVHDLVMPAKAVKLLQQSAKHAENGKLITMNSVQQAIEATLDVKVSVADTAEDRDKLLNMEEYIHQRMINQTRAVQVVSDALRRARTGVRNENRPIGTFLFLGPTGVGKTELAKSLADVYFNGEDRVVRIDLNEYVRAEDVSRLIADGADNSGSLTAQIMKQPFSVVLLDEIEKAAPEVLSTLLQMLDEGILRDIKNREVSFRDAIVIATSNAGATRIREYVERGYNVGQFEQQFVDELINSNQFRPEFLNRFDEIVVFTPLTKGDLFKVVDLMLAGVNKTLEPQKVMVEVEQDAKAVLVDKGYDPRLGARPMRRVVQKAVENTVAKAMLANTLQSGGKLIITAEQVEQIFGVHEQAQSMIEPPQM